MKILIVSCVFPPEPVVSASISEELSKILSGTNSVTVITPHPSRPYGFKFKEKISIDAGYKLVRLDSYTHPASGFVGRLVESVSFGIESYKFILAQNELDKVYMNTWPIFAQLGVSLACIKKKIPYIIHVQDIYPESLTNKLNLTFRYLTTSLLLQIEKYILRNALKIIAISNTMKTYLAESRNIALVKFEVINNWQDETPYKKFHKFWPLDTHKFIFLYLGNIGPVAGVDFLVRSFGKAKIDAKLIIAGSGTDKQNCIEVSKEYTEADITFLDVPEGKVAEIQSQANVLLLPIKKNTGNNSIPSKLPSYMFSERPIIALSDKNSDVTKCIIDAECGWVGSPEDEKWLIASLQKIVKIDQQVLKMKGTSGLQFAEKNFSKDKNLNKLTNTILNN